ncbi:MAG: ABC transporter ATP-binding protein [Clostridiales bacterium]|nr:ABC transporter ATP-binding protein [Clostridiales bacterium]
MSENNIVVGIRGVNLSFDKGEFVAVTGKSGSGKSTLLNVISGMDSYEEGELYVEGEPTSHYLQSDWEDYRQKHISFIFQDYNIIESFSVLQNVELALMHIEDRKARRRRALELLQRVGLSSHVRHKGSALSGGQKQRTVIARALAKDSPIILADEPTGNLDSQTSKEIIELLKEVAKDKLLIVVTHSFGQLEDYATRNIRIYDRAVEFDHVISRPAPSAAPKSEPYESSHRKAHMVIKNGLELGAIKFRTMPKLSVFMCLLMIISSLGVYLVTALCGEALELMRKPYMFTPVEGRVVLVKSAGGVITEAELEKLKNDLGAQSYLHYDYLLDMTFGFWTERHDWYSIECVFGGDFGVDVGKKPEAADEVLLYLPITFQPEYGKSELKNKLLPEHIIFSDSFKVVGVKYYYDNNLSPKIVFTEEGFKVATAMYYLNANYSDFSLAFSLSDSYGLNKSFTYNGSYLIPSFTLPENSFSVYQKEYTEAKNTLKMNQEKAQADGDKDYTSIKTVTFSGTVRDFQYYGGGYYYGGRYYDIDVTPMPPGGGYGTESKFIKDISGAVDIDAPSAYLWTRVLLSPDLMTGLMDEYFAESYQQASLFFGSFSQAHKKATQLREMGYVAVVADTTMDNGMSGELILGTILLLGSVVLWVVVIIFLAFFVSLCSSRAIMAMKGDLAVMRSMGITVSVVKAALYAQMLINLIPAYIAIGIAAAIIYTNPYLNGTFTFLYAWQYALIALGLLIIILRVTRRQTGRIFEQSVKKTMRGAAE